MLILVGAIACEDGTTNPATPAGDSASAPGGSAPKVALVMKSLANEFFQTMEDGAQAHQQQNPTRYELIAEGIKNELDVSRQIDLVEQMVARGAQALVLAPADSKALVAAADKAVKAGLTVVNIDNRLDEDALKERGPPESFGPVVTRGESLRIFCLACVVVLASSSGYAQSSSRESVQTSQPPSTEERIVTSEEVAEATTSNGTNVLKVLGWPINQLMRGMNAGLVSFERNKVQQKISGFQARLNARGIGLLYGGLGQGSGMGFGITQEIPPRPGAQARDYLGSDRTAGLRLTARISPLTGYQEFSASDEAAPFFGSSLIVHTDYQWRPFENFYGFGQDSRVEDQSSFALRQWSAGVLWQFEPSRHIRFGAEYRSALLNALGSKGGALRSVEEVFGPDLPGFDEQADIQSMGVFLIADFLRGDYGLGAHGDFSGSWQQSFGGGDVRYARYETRLEARLPIVKNSALVGQATAELSREAARAVRPYLSTSTRGLAGRPRSEGSPSTGSTDGTCSLCRWSTATPSIRIWSFRSCMTQGRSSTTRGT